MSDTLKRNTREWLETKQEMTTLQKELSGMRKRLKLQEKEVVQLMCEEQVEEIEVDGKLVHRAKSVNVAK
jgi:hypothetical protein